MTTQDMPPVAERLIRRMIAEDVEGVLACFDPEGSFRDPSGTHEGIDGLENFFQMAFVLVRDITWEVHRAFRSGDSFCFEWTFSYTLEHTVAAGKRISIEGLSIMEFRDEKLLYWRDYWDAVPVLEQAGVSSWDELLGT